MSGKTIYLIDGTSYIYRAFYALGRLSSPSGMPTNAIYGFVQMLLKVVRDRNPDYLCVVFDPPGPTHRHQLYDQYKAHRQKAPEDLVVQIPYIRQLVECHGIHQLEVSGYEADDVIASIVSRTAGEGHRVVIVSSDKDLHQLIKDPWICQWDPQRDRTFLEATVMERFGVSPRQILDYLSLTGDSSDNIPGVKGIGDKTARVLIQNWDSLDRLYDHLDEITPRGLQDKLRSGKDQAYLSRQLLSLRYDTPIDFNLSDFLLRIPNTQDLTKLYEELGFRKLLESLPGENKGLQYKNDSAVTIPHLESKVIQDEKDWLELADILNKTKLFALSLDKSPDDPMHANLIGMALCASENSAYYIPIQPLKTTSQTQPSPPSVLDGLKTILSDKRISKSGHDLKVDWVILKRHGFSVEGVDFDTMIASYLLQPGQNIHDLGRIVSDHLPHTKRFHLLSNAETEKKLPEALVREKRIENLCSRSETIYQLTPILDAKLKEENQAELFRSLEMPLIETLAAMEHRGILVDVSKLELLSVTMERTLGKISQQIYDLAKEEFNIQSPRQLSYILFDKLGLPVIKKTKSGPSTDLSVLEALTGMHPIVNHLLTYRTLSKLKGTYADTLPELVHPQTGRIHTSFNQAVTATGRLSSSNPNLQNIPIRSEEGRRIREAFIAPPDHYLLSADYSQIELRILAHYSQDSHLLEAFRNETDIHQLTAAEINGIAPHEVTAEMRRQAKTINFGIIYGMGPFGLAQRLGISRQAAKALIDRYFEKYPGVENCITNLIQRTRSHGYSETLLGRRRTIPEINSRNHTVRQQGERLAVNSPIQGSAADLIKKAMIDVERTIKEHGLQTSMLLQVHDELVFETPSEELDLARNLITKTMESVWTLSVPLKVDVGYGKNWAEAHP